MEDGTQHQDKGAFNPTGSDNVVLPETGSSSGETRSAAVPWNTGPKTVWGTHRDYRCNNRRTQWRPVDDRETRRQEGGGENVSRDRIRLKRKHGGGQRNSLTELSKALGDATAQLSAAKDVIRENVREPGDELVQDGVLPEELELRRVVAQQAMTKAISETDRERKEQAQRTLAREMRAVYDTVMAQDRVFSWYEGPLVPNYSRFLYQCARDLGICTWILCVLYILNYVWAFVPGVLEPVLAWSVLLGLIATLLLFTKIWFNGPSLQHAKEFRIGIRRRLNLQNELGTGLTGDHRAENLSNAELKYTEMYYCVADYEAKFRETIFDERVERREIWVSLDMFCHMVTKTTNIDCILEDHDAYRNLRQSAATLVNTNLARVFGLFGHDVAGETVKLAYAYFKENKQQWLEAGFPFPKAPAVVM